MNTIAASIPEVTSYPVQLEIEPALDNRNRLTTAFRIVLAIPHLLLVGGPIALALCWGWSSEGGGQLGGGGVFGAVAAVAAIIAWFAIVFDGRHLNGLWNLAAFYLRWRVRAVAYTALLRDEYPPFGEGDYPIRLLMSQPSTPRDRLTVAFRIILALPHILAVWVLGVAWALSTLIAWFAIVFTGRYPLGLYRFALGVFQWNVRVEAYILLLEDEYPPFSLETPWLSPVHS